MMHDSRSFLLVVVPDDQPACGKASHPAYETCLASQLQHLSRETEKRMPERQNTGYLVRNGGWCDATRGFCPNCATIPPCPCTKSETPCDRQKNFCEKGKPSVDKKRGKLKDSSPR